MEDFCFKCGKSGNLVDVISDGGLKRACEKCAEEDRLILIKKPTSVQLKKSEISEPSFRERVKDFEKNVVKPNVAMKVRNEQLRSIMDKNLSRKFSEIDKRDDLIRNFHWILMRKRRSLKLTQDDLAKELDEPGAVIAMAERGILPKNSERVIDKFERYFDVCLRKEGCPPKEIKKELPENLEIDDFYSKELTIRDLQEIGEKSTKKKKLSQAEINDMIFQK